MNLTKLHYFIEVARCGSFSEASRQLYTSQSNLSKQIGLLENELNIKLFRRTNKSVIPTKAGQYLYDRLRNVPELINETCAKAKILDRDETDLIRIGVIKSSSFNLVLSQIYRELVRTFPEADFELEYSDFRQLRAGFESSVFDLAVTKSYDLTQVDPGVTTKTLYSMRPAVLVCSDNPLSQRDSVSMKELRDEDFIIMEQFEAPGYNRNFRSACTDACFSPRVARRTRRMESLIMYVANDVGVGWSDTDVSVPSTSNVKMLPVSDVPAIEMVAVWHRGRRSELFDRIADLIGSFRDPERNAPAGGGSGKKQ